MLLAIVTPWPVGEEQTDVPECSAAAVTRIKGPSDVRLPAKLAPSAPASVQDVLTEFQDVFLAELPPGYPQSEMSTIPLSWRPVRRLQSIGCTR